MDDHFRFSQLKIASSQTLTIGRLSLTPQSLTLIRSGNSAQFITTTGKSTWFGSVSAMIMADARQFKSVQVRPTAVALFSRKTSEKFAYRLGAGYSFMFGNGQAFPVLGFTLKVSDRSQLGVTLPYRIFYHIRHSSQYRSTFFLRPDGGISLIDMDLNLDSMAEKASFLRTRAFSLGYQGVKVVNKQVQFRLGGGFLFRRKLFITPIDYQLIEKSQEAYSFKLKAGVFAEISILYYFGADSNSADDQTDSDSESGLTDFNYSDLW